MVCIKKVPAVSWGIGGGEESLAGFSQAQGLKKSLQLRVSVSNQLIEKPKERRSRHDQGLSIGSKSVYSPDLVHIRQYVATLL